MEPRDLLLIKVRAAIQQAMQGRRLPSGHAGKLRGQCTWTCSLSFGRVGRGALNVLKRCQYEDIDDLNNDDVAQLHFRWVLLGRIPARALRICGERAPPLLLYTDASWPSIFDGPERTVIPRLGWLLLHQDSGSGVGKAMDIPKAWEEQLFIERRTQIYAAETLAPWMALRFEEERVQGQDLILFIDNQGAMTALITGASRAEDAAWMVHVQHLLWCRLRVRVWIEWVDSDSNPSDGLSREGVTDPWTVRMATLWNWQLKQVDPPPIDSLMAEATRLLPPRMV